MIYYSTIHTRTNTHETMKKQFGPSASSNFSPPANIFNCNTDVYIVNNYPMTKNKPIYHVED